MKRLGIAFTLMVALHAVDADEYPRWELGFGMAGLSIADYRGSNQRRQYLLPLPYVIYRGDWLAIDREGVHSHLFTSDRVDLTFSLGVGPPARSDGGVRAGMPDLDPTFEVGPQLTVVLARNAARDRVWSLNLPLRAAVATDLKSLDGIGAVFAPYLRFEAARLGSDRHGVLDISLGPLYASEPYHDYYYEVAPAFATAARPAYDARGGYSGSRVTLAFTRHHPRYWFGAFLRYDRLDGAAFETSPVVERDDSLIVGAGFAWVLARSK